MALLKMLLGAFFGELFAALRAHLDRLKRDADQRALGAAEERERWRARADEEIRRARDAVRKAEQQDVDHPDDFMRKD